MQLVSFYSIMLHSNVLFTFVTRYLAWPDPLRMFCDSYRGSPEHANIATVASRGVAPGNLIIVRFFHLQPTLQKVLTAVLVLRLLPMTA